MNTALQPGRRKIGTDWNQAAVKLEPTWNQAGAKLHRAWPDSLSQSTLSGTLGSPGAPQPPGKQRLLLTLNSTSPFPNFFFYLVRRAAPDFPRGVGVALGSQVDSLIRATGGVFFFLGPAALSRVRRPKGCEINSQVLARRHG